MPANGREITQRFEKLLADAANHFQQCERMAPFLAPSRLGIQGAYAPGEPQTRGVYDGTMMAAAELMAHFIAGNIIDPATRWVSYAIDPDPNLSEDEFDECMEWCQESTERTLHRAEDSAFYAEGAEALIDWGGFGTGCNLIEENPQPPNFSIRGFRGFNVCAKKTGRFLIQEGGDGKIDTVISWYDFTARVIKDLWGERGTIPENITRAIAEGKGDSKFCVIHVIEPRSKGDRSGYGATSMPWRSCWVEKESKTIIYESGYRVFPAAVPRYHRTPGEVFGRGRGQLAFPDSWTLNSAKRMSLEDWALKIKPPVLHGHDSVFGTLRLIPGAPVSVNTHGKPIKDSVAPYETGSNPEVTNINEENLRKAINERFYVQHILNLLEVSKSEMTAYEYAKKLQLLFKLIGPVYARARLEFLYANADIMFDVQSAAKDFSPPPPAMFRTNGDIRLRFQNPLELSQRAEDVEAFTMAIADLAPIGQVKPEVWDWFDVDKIGPGVMRSRGVRADWTRDFSSVQKLREERAKQDMAQLQLDQMEQMASAAGKAKPILEMVSGGKK